MPDAEVTVIGAGVVGLAVAARLSAKYGPLFVIERHASFGQETSSRNSEVIHGGMYYPKDSLKALLCVKGNRMLYEFCRKYEIPHNNCGKLIVATSEEELLILERIRNQAIENGVGALPWLGPDKISELEPNISAIRALFSQSTGIVDSHALMHQLETQAVNQGAQMVYHSEVSGLKKLESGYEVTLTEPDGSPYTFTSKYVVNAAGLGSARVAAMLGICDDALQIIFCKGEYFRIKPPKNRLVSRLVYPVPNPNMEGIGIHVTVDMAGGVKLGPDVGYMESNIYDYSLTPSKQQAFFDSARRFLPFLDFEDIAPEMAGIRPKTQKPGQPATDFYVCHEKKRGYPGLINLIGIESPGLTASLALAEYVEGIL